MLTQSVLVVKEPLVVLKMQILILQKHLYQLRRLRVTINQKTKIMLLRLKKLSSLE